MNEETNPADLAQRVADLKRLCDTYKAAWAGYHPLAEYMQGLADGGNLPGAIGEHFGDIAIKRMKGQDARITDLEAERDRLQHEHHTVRADAQARVDAAVIRALAAEKERDELRSRTELAESRLAVMVERDGARDEQLRLACRERDELRARMAEMERQEPVAWQFPLVIGRPDVAHTTVRPHGELAHLATPLYARPVPAVQEGWKLVPVEPTPEMLDVGRKRMSALGTYTAMLAAAPERKA